ncbi:phosphomannomutase [Devosia pacifica]|uniref:Phosphomannomutase n=1 Tax=Devosia pacifica TaxID=1335967 RepID=A0A918SCH0_9HYPH|nr:phosphomannomutase [Devosia pacifica]GHA32626.1 phosphomannomutase [Devosia pacifica]
MTGSLKFGTSGLRGLVTELSDATCAAYAEAFVAHLQQATGSLHEAVLIGQDLRASSPQIARACAQGLARVGVASINCGTLPTPALALEAQTRSLPAIMVTGSHIPDDRNGLKFYLPQGEITKADEAGITASLATHESEPASVDLPQADGAALDRYAQRYSGLNSTWSLAGLTVGVYQHSSVARDLMVTVLEALGATCLPMARADSFVPVDTEALRAEDTALAQAFAEKQALDAIVSTDGDADRPLISDATGRFLRGDIVGLLTAQRLGAEAVVTPVTSSTAIEASGLFKSVHRTRVGSPFVIGGMQLAAGEALAPVVGFEANGGVLLGSDTSDFSALPTRDALLPIIAVLSLSRQRNQSLADIVASLPSRYTASDRLQQIPSAASSAWLAKLTADPEAMRTMVGARGPVADMDMTDGVRLRLASGDIVHFRASGNAPELRCYTESGSQQEADDLLMWGLATARAAVLEHEQN